MKATVYRDTGDIRVDNVPDSRIQVRSNVTLHECVSPARAYVLELLSDVIAQKIDPSPVLDLTVDLEDILFEYKPMNERVVIQVMEKL